MVFNPFDYINKEDINKRVNKIKKKKPALSNEEICLILLKKKSRWCAAAGAVTAMPGIFPVIGTLVAAFAGTVLDMAAMSFLLTEMILEMAAVYGRNLNLPGPSKEAVWVLVSSVGAGVAGRGLTGITVARLSGRAFTSIIEQAFLALGIRTTQRSILRVIPFIGTVIAGAVNYYTCKKVGEFVLKYYSRNAYNESWDGKTVDVETEFIENSE